MTTFVALYRGATITEARLVAVSADPDLVGYIATRLLDSPEGPTDPVLIHLDRGRRAALRVIRREAAPQ